jgi:predicted DNA-binding transcriptional regulator AlpA
MEKEQSQQIGRRLIAVREMSERSGFSESYFYTGWSTGKLRLPRVKIGRATRVKDSDFEAWLDGADFPEPPERKKEIKPWVSDTKPWTKRGKKKSISKG